MAAFGVNEPRPASFIAASERPCPQYVREEENGARRDTEKKSHGRETRNGERQHTTHLAKLRVDGPQRVVHQLAVHRIADDHVAFDVKLQGKKRETSTPEAPALSDPLSASPPLRPLDVCPPPREPSWRVVASILSKTRMRDKNWKFWQMPQSTMHPAPAAGQGAEDGPRLPLDSAGPSRAATWPSCRARLANGGGSVSRILDKKNQKEDKESNNGTSTNRLTSLVAERLKARAAVVYGTGGRDE